MDVELLAQTYRAAVTAAATAGVQADPEAQLTTPVDVLLTTIAAERGLGTIQLIREQQLPGSRPDFGALIDGRFCGWVELKKPDTAIDAPELWTGHNGKQWKRLKELDNLLLCNGREIRRYVLGEPAGDAAALPYVAGPWALVPCEKLLRQFVEASVRPITSVRQLAERLAPLARDLRDRLVHVLEHPGTPGSHAAQNAGAAWRVMLQEDATDKQFADGVAQVVTYGLVIVALENDTDAANSADTDGDGVVSLAEARAALRGKHVTLSAALSPILEVKDFLSIIELEVGSIALLVSGVNRKAIAKRKDPRGEPWLWFYEDFLAAYDPGARREAGVYYTPIEVVDCITRLVEDVLVTTFDKPLGFGDDAVTTLDPACGTGTFPLSVIDRAADRASTELGPAGPAQVATTLGKTLFGFELLPGPFAVAHLRIAERLRTLGGVPPKDGVNILLADTLSSPHGEDSAQLGLFGDAAVLAAERQRARLVKREQPVMVVLGNPPYHRYGRDEAGGWVVHGDKKTPVEKALFTEVVEDANKHAPFGERRSLYNLYTYFWRWAIWKAFEAHDAGPAVVAFITASSWIESKGFIGLQRLAEKHCDEINVIDLGGDNKAVVRDENVFAIESPVAIVTLIRHAKSDGRKRPTVRYRRIEGTSIGKLAALRNVEAPAADPDAWELVPRDAADGWVPQQTDPWWAAQPFLIDLMPWQSPGVILARTWPVAPDPAVLDQRWAELLREEDSDARTEKFVTPKTGRNMTKSVGGRPPLMLASPDAPPPGAARYAWRAFDRQWVIADPRVAALERPVLWRSQSPNQLYFAAPSKEAIGPGPAATVSAEVPDFHTFAGRGGKDIVALYRDGDGAPNITTGLLDRLQELLDLPATPTPEHVAAYSYALMSTPHYQERFAEYLVKPGIRIPITRDAELWKAAVAKGSWLLWLHSYAQRFRTPDQGKHVPKVDGLGWRVPVSAIPESDRDTAYDPDTREISVGDGRIQGVDQAVWDYSVSSYPVVRRWLGFRTKRGSGNAATRPKPLDRIRPQKWLSAWNTELLDLLRILTLTIEQDKEQAALLDTICDGALVQQSELPTPSTEDRATPSVDHSNAPTQVSM